MVVAITALFVALGGTGYAALSLPPHSVGKKELKRNAVTTAKIDNGTLRLKDFYRPDLRRIRRGGGGEDGLDGFDGFDGLDGVDGLDGLDGASGSALLTGGAGGLPDTGDSERAAINGNTNNPAATTAQVASMSPNRELVLRDLSAGVANGAAVTFAIVAMPFGGSVETVVIDCSVTAANPTCTAPGPATLPANHLIAMRITGGNVGVNPRAYWGVSAEPVEASEPEEEG